MDNLSDLRKLKAAIKLIADKFNLDIIDFSVSVSDKHEVDNDNARAIFRIRNLKSFISNDASKDDGIDNAFNEIISGFNKDQENDIRKEIDKWMEE